MTRKRIVLNPETAREIEALAPSFADSMRRGVKSRLSNALAVQFGVDAKTIRDIWNRKSWKGFNQSNNTTIQTDAAQTIADSFLRSDHDEIGGSDEWDPQLTLQNLLEMNSTLP